MAQWVTWLRPPPYMLFGKEVVLYDILNWIGPIRD
jgi:hypothetical protein